MIWTNLVKAKFVTMLLAISFGTQCPADEAAAIRVFGNVQHDPILLHRFLREFPKGADLHIHLDGAIYAEQYLEWASADDKCIALETFQIQLPPCRSDNGVVLVKEMLESPDRANSVGLWRSEMIDALSTRNHGRRSVAGADQFFGTFSLFRNAGAGREGDMLARVTARAAEQNVVYLELMHSWGMDDAAIIATQNGGWDLSHPISEYVGNKDIDQVVATVIEKTNEAEARRKELLGCEQKQSQKGCQVILRYMPAIIRTLAKEQVLAQAILGLTLVERDNRYVGINFVAPEYDPTTIKNHTWQMHMLRSLVAEYSPRVSQSISLHEGEMVPGLVPPEYLGKHIREAIEIAGASRIGHGVDIGHDANMEELLLTMAENNILVEINLTSNEVILEVTGGRHPLNTYVEFSVPVSLSTDDEGVLRTDLTHEYQKAVESYGVNYEKLKEYSRNSLQYSFLRGPSLFRDYETGETVPQCANALVERRLDSSCTEFLSRSDKGTAQWTLEVQLSKFEDQFRQ